MAAGSTYTPIATTTGTGSSGTVTFASIPQIYTDLVLVVSGIMTSSSTDYLSGRVGNGSIDTGPTSYSQTSLYGNGSSATSARNSNSDRCYYTWTPFASTTNPATAIINFQNYSNTSTYKTVISRFSEAGTSTATVVNTWRNTAAINTLSIIHGASNFATSATFTLYGIAKA